MTALATHGLTKHFGETCAVDSVELRLDAGEVRGLLGPNGAGKTTLLRLLLGLVRADAGEVQLLGRPAGNPSSLEGVGGFVEEPSFYPYLSARANLEVLARLDGGASAERIDAALEEVELAARAEDRVAGYSTGMRKRLGLAAALMRAPRLLLLDEPTAGLDPAGVRFVGGLVRSLAAEGVAVLLSSHQIAEVEDACDSFTVLSRGRVVWDGSTEEMLLDAPPSAYRLATADDERALAIAAGELRARAFAAPDGGLVVEATSEQLDAVVLALGRAGVAVRRLELAVRPLESMFFSLVEEPPPGPGAIDSTPPVALDGHAPDTSLSP
jgi:ABC-2 type transport system ATP-binding protein